MKKCPFCSEEIQDEAVKCRFCGEDVSKNWIDTKTDIEKIYLSIKNGDIDLFLDRSNAFTFYNKLRLPYCPFPLINMGILILTLLYGVYAQIWIQTLLALIFWFLTINFTPPFISRHYKTNYWLLLIIVLWIYINYGDMKNILVFIPSFLIFISQKLSIYFSMIVLRKLLMEDFDFFTANWSNWIVHAGKWDFYANRNEQNRILELINEIDSKKLTISEI